MFKQRAPIGGNEVPLGVSELKLELKKWSRADLPRRKSLVPFGVEVAETGVVAAERGLLQVFSGLQIYSLIEGFNEPFPLTAVVGVDTLFGMMVPSESLKFREAELIQ